MKIILFILSLMSILTVGCTTIEVKTTEYWEGHYITVEEFKNKTENIVLEENMSIWVLSNNTLKRILK